MVECWPLGKEQGGVHWAVASEKKTLKRGGYLSIVSNQGMYVCGMLIEIFLLQVSNFYASPSFGTGVQAENCKEMRWRMTPALLYWYAR